MQHPNFETRHPLQTEEQEEAGFDPLNNFNKNRSRGSVDSSTTSQSTFLTYRKEWDDLFLNSNYLARIRQAGINGRLRSSRFRSHITNPRKAAGQQDLVVNNPLSQDEGSLWNKFFQDKELKGMIKQDVLRTFPEIRYFQDEDVRTKLTDILFCYARENEQLLYKQGMHELLAPIVFVLHCDHQAFQHASETASPRLVPAFTCWLLHCLHLIHLKCHFFLHSEEMKCLLNPLYLEHDAYALFSQLMETAEPWFSSYEREVRRGKEEMLTSMPFARPQDSGPSVAIVTKVNRIQDQLVKKHDVELHMHLNRLEIAPQIYGISATKPAPLNINKVSSSLLSFGRKLIAPAMSGGSSSVSPINSEVHASSPASPTTTPAVPHPLAEPPPVQAPLQTQHYRLLKSESMPVHLSKGQSSKTVSSSPSQESLTTERPQSSASPSLPPSRGGSDISTSSPPLSAGKKESFFGITRSRSHSKTMGRKEAEEDLEAQVSFLQGQLNDLEAMSKYCAKMMNTHICKIQEVILQEHLDKEDEVLVSLAGLKQVASSVGSEGKNWEDYILVSQDGDLQAADGGSSSPDEGSTHSKDSDFTIVNPTTCE
ncbi:unnamed protein product [Lampetra planeri]